MYFIFKKGKKHTHTHNKIEWRWKSNWESWFDSLINCPWRLPPTFGKFPYTGLVWGWLFSLPFSLFSCFPKSLRYPGTNNLFFFFFLSCSWKLTTQPLPPTQVHFPLSLHFTSSGGETLLKSRSIKGSVYMPLACFLMFRGTRNTCMKYDVGAPYSFPLRLMDSGAPAPSANRWGPQVATCPLRPAHFLLPDFHRGSQAAACILKGRATLPFITMAAAGQQPPVVIFSRRHLQLGLCIAFFQWLVICGLWLYVEKGLSLPGSPDQ